MEVAALIRLGNAPACGHDQAPTPAVEVANRGLSPQKPRQ